ncbi:5-dehydro-4-deoxy-D-glucuronate isomerase [Synoicihabitans lomoniglobus]|uniref:5-dehydro-4-deoxy-D-glucuronate isomerase n=1 Tax=Synoicihabitans lomoniglobus TaxID=2909285 RepID=A0AAE9ZUK0_9BACT|nr:5-dehydro-4-deoxy-D-glucuronate isomerase [Opitutaceae bacterium LMO-M01]WED63284.1 5-dehydro-4-deoxy-D-glucuronate isomerase [Opitutaceae bacterium LMO-M01]
MQHFHDVHPADFDRLTTAGLRERFLLKALFCPGEQRLNYWDVDRTVVGGVVPTDSAIMLDVPAKLAAGSFCERRELGIINLGGAGAVRVGETIHQLEPHDGLYLGRGAANPVFTSVSATKPAQFYLLSYPAHASLPTTVVRFTEMSGTSLGSAETANERTIYKYFAPGLVTTCQLVMGFTVIARGSVWNTMPPHTHLRRSEVYCYCRLAPGSVVMHFMGPPSATRHLVMRDGDAVISPSWSIHSGAGTGAYAFVWGMGGENQEFSDMDAVAMSDLA